VEAGVSDPGAGAAASRRPHRFFAALAYLPGGWARDVGFTVDEHGYFTAVAPGASAEDRVRVAGVMLPGMVNAHSHAFQRAMVGLTHRAGAGAIAVTDNFWSWRSLMYALALRLTPEQIESIATWVYTEMLRGGYTHVCEFHYLHNDPAGRPYADPAELSRAVLRAAANTGIGITLLPVLYMTSGFGATPPRDEQRRFLSTPERLLAMMRRLADDHRGDRRVAFGLAPHSLRAVPPDALDEVVRGLRATLPAAPIHIHIAEQTGEVDACIAWSGQRPVEWLLDHQSVDAHWNLVHATHMSESEAQRAARSGAVAVLCPTTEADLGDGVFAYPAWAQAQGRIAIGSDSQVSRDWWSELRMLEYSQRLAIRQRNVGAGPGQSSAETLFDAALAGGALSSGLRLGRIEAGARADWLAVREDKLAFAARSPEHYLDSLVFDHHAADFADVVVAGLSRRESLQGDVYRDARNAFIHTLDQVSNP
jgi:formimidoylglutamate deiminase